MTLTRSRTLQYVIIILVLAAIAVGGYWFYLKSKASTQFASRLSGSTTSGLVGYWTFDGADISGTTATDRGSGGNNGTLTSSPTKIAGKAGQALSFNGTSSYVSIADNAVFTLDPTQKYTWAMWVRMNSLTNEDWQALWSQDVSTSVYFYIYAMTTTSDTTWGPVTNGITVGWESPDGSNAIFQPSNSNVLAVGQWAHVAVTYDGAQAKTSRLKIYINGVDQTNTGDTVAPGTITSLNPTNIRIGSDASYGEYVDGSLDDVRYYNRLLSVAEISTLVGSGLTESSTVGSNASSYDASIVGYWKMDEGTGTSASDMSGWGNTGTLTNSPTWGTGKYDGGVTFDGTDDYINIGDPSSGVLDLSSVAAPFGITGWFNRSTYTTDDTIVAKKNDQATNAGYIVYIDDADDKLHALFSDGTSTCDLISAETFTSAGWHHFIISFDESYNTSGQCGYYELYIDGFLSDNGNLGTYTYGSYANSLAFRIGAESDGGNPFAGSLDDIRVYGRRMGMEATGCLECSTMANQTASANIPVSDSTIVGWWPFDGTTLFGTTAADMARSPHKGTLANGPASTLGRIGQALLFDGTDDQITITHNTALDPDDLTLTLWMRRDGTQNANAQVLGKPWSSSGDNNWSYSLEFDGGGNYLWWEVNDSNLSLPTVDSLDVIPDGQWTFVAGTYQNSNKTMELFINGVSQGTYVLPGSRVKYTGDIGIGRYIGGGGEFKGALDDIRLYNRVLSSAEIYQLSQSGTTNVGGTLEDPLKQGLAGYWALDNGSGVSATDGSGNGNNGTLTNGPTWGTGKISGSLSFDGTNDYVTMTSPGAFSTFSVSLWVRCSVLPGTGEMTALIKNVDRNFQFRWDSTAGNGETFGIVSTGGSYFGVSIGPIVTNTWIHLVGTWDGTTLRSYNNGALIESGTPGFTIDTGGSGLELGRDNNYAGYFQGDLDEVRVYSRALSSDEVAKLYQQTSPAGGIDSNLAVHWTFDGPDVVGTVAHDRSGKGYNGNMTNSPTPALGRIGQALDFDGVDTFVDVPGAAPLTSAQKSFSVWIRPRSAGEGNFGHIVATAGTNGTLFSMCHNDATECPGTSNTVELFQYFSTSNGEWYIATDDIIKLNEWNHVVVTYDAGSTANNPSFYVNGVSQTVTEGLTPSGTKVADSDFHVGVNDGASANFAFDGLIDDVRAYSRILTQAEVTALYNMGK